MTIHISNLDQNLIEADIRRLFTPFGEIDTVQIDRDQHSNRSRGKATVEMPAPKEAQDAILNLNGITLGQKKILVTGIPGTDDRFAGKMQY